jgi:glucose-6-phosphate 1-dehydrogenase
MEAYERLLGDAIDGFHALFAREDSVEQTWRIVTPTLENPSPIRFYEPGSWGPHEADDLVKPFLSWHNPTDNP